MSGMKRDKCRLAVSLTANLLTAALVAYAVLSYFWFPDGSGVVGATCFRYFTIDSNVLCAAFAVLLAVYQFRALRGREIPRFAVVCKYVGTVAVCVTFLTVVVFLGPTQGYGKMFAGAGFWLHLVCPLLAMASFCLTEAGEDIWHPALWLGLVPTALYGVLYLTMVIFIGAERGGWVDFYGFNIGGLWQISFAAMLALTVGIAFGLCALRRLALRKMKNSENEKELSNRI